ncbi:hypothetical protein GCM10009678_53290 [Actinomadura kijaniata]|uniref:Uncharacterized protein n=1 Tax=Actinomadura namibiensis TaxID=182080 RepID=A0A7W3LRT8_ACTNM|nr:hypothetical protein [Actinomadura namibiensis]MBA8953108.1 hypothetical protein [Actinomadura namibiensis]
MEPLASDGSGRTERRGQLRVVGDAVGRVLEVGPGDLAVVVGVEETEQVIELSGTQVGHWFVLRWGREGG